MRRRPQPVEQPSGARPLYEFRVNELQPAIRELQKRLAFRNNRNDLKERQQTHGRLDTRRLYRATHPINDGAVWYTRSQQSPTDTQIAILIDESGSMGKDTPGTPLQLARDAASIIQEATRSIRGVTIWTAGFSSDRKPILRLYTTSTDQAEPWALRQPPISGSTPTGACLWAIARIFSDSSNKNQDLFLFLIDDGNDGYSTTINTVQKMFSHIDMTEIRIGGRNQEPSDDQRCNHYIGIQNAQELQTLLPNQVATLLTANTRKVNL